jgi:nucleotide-binding universal stress UspA family protein
VLVAHPHDGQGAIIAATDLEDPRFPVVHYAADLAARLTASLVLVHNVTPDDHEGINRGRWLLGSLAEQAGDAAQFELSSRPSAAESILAVARRRDADLVIVGIRTRRWPQLLHAPAAAAVLAGALRSVLVTPIVRKRHQVP